MKIVTDLTHLDTLFDIGAAVQHRVTKNKSQNIILIQPLLLPLPTEP